MSAKALRLPVEIFDRSGYDDYYIFCLPSAGRDALLSMSHRLYWSIWTDEDGSRISLNDEQMALIDATVAELTGGVQVQCLEEQFDRLIEAIQSISINVNSGGSGDMSVINNCVSCGGCGCSQCNGGYPWGDDPTQPPLPPLPSTDPTYPGETYPAEWCDRATEVASRYVDAVSSIGTWFTGIAVTVEAAKDFISYKYAGWGGLWPIVISALVTALAFIIEGLLTADVATLANSIKNDLICAVLRSDSPAEADENFARVINDATVGQPVPVVAFMRLMNLFVWDSIFDLEGRATDPAYVGSNCEFCDSGGGGGGGGEPDPSTEPQQVEDEAWYMCPVLSVEYDSGNAQRFHQLEAGTNIWEMVATNDGLNVVRFNPHPHGFGDLDLETVAAQDGYVVLLLEGGEGTDTGFSNWLAGGSCMHPYGKFSNHPGVNCFYHIRPGLAGGDLEVAFLAYAASQGWLTHNLGDDMDKTRMSFECRSEQEERWTCQIWLIVPEEDVNVPE